MRRDVNFQDYFGRGNHTKTYEKTNHYCPSCGKRETWTDNGAGDYYEGPTFLCTNCEIAFTLPTLRKINASLLEEYIVKRLK